MFIDVHSGDLIDIVEDRRLSSLIKYFSRYSRLDRLKVKRVVFDMYKPYIKLIKTMFPKALIVMDKFHIVQLISCSLNKRRVAIMNKDKDNYTKLKRYWKLLLKDRTKVDITNYRREYCLKQMMCEEDIINYLINLNDELKDTYELYQDLLRCIKTKDIENYLSIR